MNTFIVNSRETCENLLQVTICDKFLNNQPCIWKGKVCVLTSSSITARTDCQNYLSICTLTNPGSGYVVLPLKCETITIEAACQIKMNGQLC
ncbi:unnamed protein product (macronuclear) [Paramecium tetraurelia]|uniref:Uncharacterized protein n=1 Tax=Paramecium tetraurelia TaxID=5888 RepID=A0CMV8_PARTE|nr:uncharacterized protein GSPATT00038742001 [Paramecium tetraurelia]CAK72125.1 unnamed protein product [Paramecium tetraurelia]|eukprot:XP_001439522.1 hypothetical protein (macronuclear) [Paramecium tetraurelia strain d4-2]